MNYNPGDVVLIAVEGLSNQGIGQRPAFILYADEGSLIIAGVTRSKHHRGVDLTEKDGATKPCRVLLHYMFTVSSMAVLKKLFTITGGKKKEIYKKLKSKIAELK